MSERVSVAVVDSGVNVPHPHLPAVAGGLAIDLEGNESEVYVDRLGHGTAVAAAIHEKAPDAEIFAVKVFDAELATTVANLVRAIDWASARGFRLVNLSLGTPNDFRAPELAPAVDRAVAAGTIVVSAFEHEERLWFPGSMTGCMGVVLDMDVERHTVVLEDRNEATLLRASPYPRPIPGVPLDRNLNGISFAVANASGVLAQLLGEHPAARSVEDVIGLLRASLNR